MREPVAEDVATIAKLMDQLTETVHGITHDPDGLASAKEDLWHSSIRLCDALLALTRRLVADLAACS